MNSWGVIKPNSIIIPNDGDIGSAGANDAIQIDSNGIVTFKDDIKIKDGGTIGTGTTANAVTIAADGTVTLVGNLVVDSTKGIDFSATANAPNSGTTTDSELLNDYEEGRFTAIIGATSTNPNLTYSEQEGRYVKIGRQVTVTTRFAISSQSSPSGDIRFHLPFTSNTQSENESEFYGTVWYYQLTSTSDIQFVFQVVSNTNYGRIQKMENDGGATSSVSSSDLANSFYGYTVTYFTA